MSNTFFNAAQVERAVAVTFYVEVERPCWHKKKRRRKDKRKGRYHSKSHIVTEEYMSTPTIDKADAANDETIVVSWDSRGRFQVV